MRIVHLKTARELFQYLASLFETKKRDVTQREATRNPRTRAGTHQECSEDSRKARDCEEAAKKAKSTVVEEPRDATCRKPKRDARSHGRVERKGREGERAAGRTSEQGAEQTQIASGRAGEASADAANPCATSARPTRPAGASCNPQVEPHEIADSDDASRIAQGVDKGGERGHEKGEGATGRPSEKVAARGPGESPTDQGADGVSLAAPASSPTNSPHEDTAAKRPGEGAMDQTADGVSLAVPASSPNEHGVETSTDETTNETTAPPSMPLEGERDSLTTSGSTRVYSEGAEPPDDAADAQGATQGPRYTDGTRTGQQHDASAHGEGRCARAEWPSSMHERHGCTTSSHADEEAHTPSAPKVTHEGDTASCQVRTKSNEDDAAAAAATQPVGRYSGCIHMPHDANDEGGTHRWPRRPQCEGERSPMAQVVWEDDLSAMHPAAPHDPGGICRRNQSSEVGGEMGDQSEGDDNGRNGGVNSDDGATSNAGRESRGLAPKMLAEDEARQDHWYVHRRRDDVPGPSTLPMNRPKRPTTSANPPRRRGRLKTRPRRSIGHPHTRKRAPAQDMVTSGPYRANRSRRMHRICIKGTGGTSPGQQGPQARYSKCSTRRPRAPIARKRETHRELPYRVTARTQRFEPRHTYVHTILGHITLSFMDEELFF
ncbi:hypothetical protein BU15DRAFT_83988 [Melanogaster broomeanus]|nr:hypothetical protein BU15DRAFT_83988 [Melanogaster broomeanus]